MPTLATFIQEMIGSPLAWAMRPEKETKDIQIGKKCHDILYRKSWRCPKLSGLINKFSKVAGYKSIYRISMAIYTLTANYWKEKLRNSPIYNSIKNNKILRNEFNHRSERSIYWKLRHWWKELKTWIHEKIFCVHG